MEKFYGRREELEELERLYALPRSETCAIFGRRRTGKTALIRRFCRDKRALLITAPGRSRELTSAALTRDVSAFAGNHVEIGSCFDLVDYLGTLGRDGKVVVVIDEFPLLADQMDEAPPVLQRFIDHDMPDLNMMLIVCGSSMRAMGQHLNDGDAPLFGRFLQQMRLEPLSYPESRMFHPDLDEEDRIRMFCINSGIPAYHRHMSGMGVRHGIASGFLGRMSLLRSEADNIVSLELKPRETYETLLSEIRSGRSGVPELADLTGISRVTCQKMVDNLVMLGIMRRETCYGSKEKFRYVMTDGFLDFHHSVVIRNEPYDRYASGEDAYDMMEEQISAFYGHRFEEVCRQYVIGTERCRWIGSWWGKVPVFEDGEQVLDGNGKPKREDADIDLVAEVENGPNRDLLLCECKFTRRTIGVRELKDLILRGECVRKGGSNKRYMLFSRSGFSEGLTEYLEDHPGIRVTLVGIPEIGSWADAAVTGR